MAADSITFIGGGNMARSLIAGLIRQVVQPEAQILQRRTVAAGDTVGYNATWTAPRETEVAILNLGYADGYLRAFSDRGSAHGGTLPVIGRVSMDLLAVDVTAAPNVAEGDWLAIDFALPDAAAQSGLPVNALVALIDVERMEAADPPNLTSAIRQWLWHALVDDQTAA